jgi:hypothetical protein
MFDRFVNRLRTKWRMRRERRRWQQLHPDVQLQMIIKGLVEACEVPEIRKALRMALRVKGYALDEVQPPHHDRRR